MSMAATTSSSASSSANAAAAEAEQRSELMKNIRTHQVALAELTSLSSSRSVYQKNGNIYFLTNSQKAASSEQKLLDQAKSQLEKLNSTRNQYPLS